LGREGELLVRGASAPLRRLLPYWGRRGKLLDKPQMMLGGRVGIDNTGFTPSYTP